MAGAEWIAFIAPTFTLAGFGYAAVVRLTRITVALEQLGKDISAVVGRVDGHEQRIARLELLGKRGRHRYP